MSCGVGVSQIPGTSSVQTGLERLKHEIIRTKRGVVFLLTRAGLSEDLPTLRPLAPDLLGLSR